MKQGIAPNWRRARWSQPRVNIVSLSWVNVKLAQRNPIPLSLGESEARGRAGERETGMMFHYQG